MDKSICIVSVCMLTYNHELYIREAIEGVLLQKTNFKIELIIGEDCSKDNTRKICLEYQNKYPDLIKLFLPQQNVGMQQNSIETLRKSSGKYIAMCEGDDYWNDPYKLQKQVDFMEANSDYAIVYHKVKIFDETENVFRPEENNLSDKEITYTIEDLAKHNFIHTPSVLLRANTLDFSTIKKSSNVFMDYFLLMICARSGKIKYLPQCMAVYRVWGGSVWALKDTKIRLFVWIQLLISLTNIFLADSKVYDILFAQIKNTYNALFFEKKDDKDQEKFDSITKKLLLEINNFQLWWFTYMTHVKSSRMYRLKFYFYLLINNNLSSCSFLKKCLYK